MLLLHAEKELENGTRLAHVRACNGILSGTNVLQGIPYKILCEECIHPINFILGSAFQ